MVYSCLEFTPHEVKVPTSCGTGAVQLYLEQKGTDRKVAEHKTKGSLVLVDFKV